MGLVTACKPASTPDPAAAAGCRKDVDCKGARVCQDGRCTDPPRRGPPAATRGAAEGVRPAASTWRRDGPGGVALSVTGPTQTPSVAWAIDLGAVIFARPVLAAAPGGGVAAFVGTHAGRFVGVGVDGAGDGNLVLDLNLGGMVWGTAAVDEEGRLYVGADNDTLYAIDPAKGAVAWKRKVGTCTLSRAPGPEGARCDADGGPTLGPDGDLYLGADGVYRMTPAGKVVWHYPGDEEAPRHVFSSPVVTSQGRVLFGGQDGFVTALDAAGNKLWRYKVRADVDGSPGMGADGTLYVGADDGRLHALRPDGSLKWSFVTQKDVRSSVGVAADGSIYVTSFDGSLYALGPQGDVKWVLPTGGRIMSSPVVDRVGNVFFGSQDDHLYGVNPGGTVLWSVELPGDVDSSVAITGDGTVVVGCDDGHLRALRAG